MQPSDKPRFAQVMALTADYYSKPLTDDLLKLYWLALADFSVTDVESAIREHMTTSPYPRLPLISEITASIGRANPGVAFPGGDEAWAICVRTFDEYDSIAVLDEIMQARSECDPIMRMGDEVGARMAFLQVYARLVTAARMAGKRPRWWVTRGFDNERYEQCVRSAVASGRLALDGPQVDALLPPPISINQVLRVCDQRGRSNERNAGKARELAAHLRALKDQLETRETVLRQSAEEQRAAEQMAADARKAEVVRRADDALARKQGDD